MSRIYRCTCLTAILLRSATISLERFPASFGSIWPEVRELVLDGLKLHFQGFGPLTGEDFFTLVEIVLDHLRDGFIVRQIANNTGHIRISGKLAGLLAAVAGHDLIAAILTGTDDSGWVTPLSLTLDTIARISSSSEPQRDGS